MERRIFKNEEILRFFKDIGLENEIERHRILSQGIINVQEDNKEITCILLDHSTPEEKTED